MKDWGSKDCGMVKAVISVMHGFDVGEHFTARKFKDLCVVLAPHTKDCYIDTFMRCARKHCRMLYKCIDTGGSLYERIDYKENDQPELF